MYVFIHTVYKLYVYMGIQCTYIYVYTHICISMYLYTCINTVSVCMYVATCTHEVEHRLSSLETLVFVELPHFLHLPIQNLPLQNFFEKKLRESEQLQHLLVALPLKPSTLGSACMYVCMYVPSVCMRMCLYLTPLVCVCMYIMYI